MNKMVVLILLAAAVFSGKLEARRAETSPSAAELNRFAQTILNRAKGQSLKQWYGGDMDTVIPSDAVVLISNSSCIRMPQYEERGGSMRMWSCKFDLAIKRGGEVLFKDHEQQQLSQNIRSRALEIPPPQIALPK